jgi:hypothetical protein
MHHVALGACSEHQPPCHCDLHHQSGGDGGGASLRHAGETADTPAFSIVATTTDCSPIAPMSSTACTSGCLAPSRSRAYVHCARRRPSSGADVTNGRTGIASIPHE